MKKYIGDISRQDAALLERYAGTARSVLEFGVGGSTQVIAQSIRGAASFTSVDTHEGWIAKTRDNLRRLGVEHRCRTILYGDWLAQPGRYDLIFDDGEESLRRDFAIRSFPMLDIGGAILFHDTRRPAYLRNALAMVELFFEEIEHIHVNERIDGVASNITVVRKKAREPYVDWNAAEGKVSWEVGRGEAPERFWKAPS